MEEADVKPEVVGLSDSEDDLVALNVSSARLLQSPQLSLLTAPMIFRIGPAFADPKPDQPCQSQEGGSLLYNHADQERGTRIVSVTSKEK